MKTQITIWQYSCDKCFHVWQTKNNKQIDPRICPKCKTVNWNANKGSQTVKETKEAHSIKQPIKHAKTAIKTQINAIQVNDSNSDLRYELAEFDFGS